jgi:hypothetical protein
VLGIWQMLQYCLSTKSTSSSLTLQKAMTSGLVTTIYDVISQVCNVKIPTAILQSARHIDKHIKQPSTVKRPLKPLPQKQSIEPKTLPLKPADTPTPTPSKISTDTPVPRINIFSPVKNLTNLKPQNIFSPATPILDISKGGRTNLMEPVESTLKKMNAGDRIKAMIKRNYVQRDLKEVNQEANKLQSAFRNFKAKKIVRTKREARKQTQSRAPMEITSTVQPARLSGVRETSRQGATTTRIHTQNQATAQ